MWQEPKLAFEDVDATELYPCVMFYSSNPGEKVKYRNVRNESISLISVFFRGGQYKKKKSIMIFA